MNTATMKANPHALVTELLTEEIQRRTRDAATLWSPSEETNKLSSKARQAQRLLNSGVFGCNTAQVASLVSVLLGEMIKVKTPAGYATLPIEPLVAVVPLENPNGHNYEIGSVAVIANGANWQAVKTDGTYGNCLPSNQLSATRPATDEEIERYVRALPATGRLILLQTLTQQAEEDDD